MLSLALGAAVAVAWPLCGRFLSVNIEFWLRPLASLQREVGRRRKRWGLALGLGVPGDVKSGIEGGH